VGLVLGHWRRRDEAARVRAGRTTGPRAARCSPEDHNGGDAYIGSLAFNGEFLAANAAPAAGDAIPVGRMVVPAGGWLGTKRSSRSAPSGAAAPRPTAEPLVSQVRQSLQRSHTHLPSQTRPGALPGLPGP